MCEDFLLPLLRWLGFKDVGLVFGWLVRDKKSCGCILIFFFVLQNFISNGIFNLAFSFAL